MRGRGRDWCWGRGGVISVVAGCELCADDDDMANRVVMKAEEVMCCI